MPLSNCLPKTVRKGIQHAMMWVYRRQSVFLQLISYNANQLLHSFIIVCPVTDNLQKTKNTKIRATAFFGLYELFHRLRLMFLPERSESFCNYCWQLYDLISWFKTLFKLVISCRGILGITIKASSSSPANSGPSCNRHLGNQVSVSEQCGKRQWLLVYSLNPVKTQKWVRR